MSASQNIITNSPLPDDNPLIVTFADGDITIPNYIVDLCGGVQAFTPEYIAMLRGIPFIEFKRGIREQVVKQQIAQFVNEITDVRRGWQR